MADTNGNNGDEFQDELPFDVPEGFERSRFNGSDYEPEQDDVRLRGQIARIYGVMLDHEWRTLSEVSQETGDPEASISAQFRHLRKKRFGSHTVNKRPRGDRANGLWEYQLEK